MWSFIFTKLGLKVTQRKEIEKDNWILQLSLKLFYYFYVFFNQNGRQVYSQVESDTESVESLWAGEVACCRLRVFSSVSPLAACRTGRSTAAAPLVHRRTCVRQPQLNTPFPVYTFRIKPLPSRRRVIKSSKNILFIFIFNNKYIVPYSILQVPFYLKRAFSFN